MRWINLHRVVGKGPRFYVPARFASIQLIVQIVGEAIDQIFIFANPMLRSSSPQYALTQLN